MNGPLEFRILTQPRPNMEQLLESNWDDRWRGRMQKYTYWYSVSTFLHSPLPFYTMHYFLCSNRCIEEGKEVTEEQQGTSERCCLEFYWTLWNSIPVLQTEVEPSHCCHRNSN